MLKIFVPKAILAGILIDFGGYSAVTLIYTVAMSIFNTFINSLSFIPVEEIFVMLSNSLFINWSINIICCSIVLFGNYQCGRMAKKNEWVNGLIAFTISLGLSLAMGWNTNDKDFIILLTVATLFAVAGTYLATLKNQYELRDIKVITSVLKKI